MIGLMYKACPNGCWHTCKFLPRLRPYPVTALASALLALSLLTMLQLDSYIMLVGLHFSSKGLTILAGVCHVPDC